MAAATTHTINASDIAADAAAAIQQAIDAAHDAGGGTLEIPAGQYVLNRAIRMKSGVTLLGEQGATLTRRPSNESPVADFLGFGHREFRVEDPSLFAVGDDVVVLDNNAGGFYTTVARIIEQRDELFFIDRAFNHDYLPFNDARVQSVFSLIDFTDCCDATIRGLTLDGNADETRVINGCRGGAVFALRAHRINIDDIEVLHFKGDCISYQQCTDVIVKNCHVHDNTGHGLHPGSGSVRWIMSNNRVEDNGGCGLFYCLRTTHGICSDNVFAANGEAGISVGERDTNHLITGNLIENNGHNGIVFRKPIARSGDTTVVRGNTIRNNFRDTSRDETIAKAEIHVAAGLKQIIIEDNNITAASETDAIIIEPGCDEIHIVENKVTSGDVGETGAFSEESPAIDWPIGPDALPLTGGRHLGIEALEPWISS